MNQIDIALRIAVAAHAGQLDRTGHPVILHPLTVGLMGNTDEEKTAGFLHDVVEDSDFTFDDLLREGISEGIVNALRLLTHEKGTTTSNTSKKSLTRTILSHFRSNIMTYSTISRAGKTFQTFRQNTERH